MVLPSEIMLKIFLLLPIESIVTCKLVSKEWKNLLGDSMLMKLYKVESATFFFDKGFLKCIFGERDKKSYKLLRCVPKQLKHHELLSDSSNKIACLKSCGGHFLLYNLFTGDLRKVKDAPFLRNSDSFWSFYGFGYDAYDDDHKIILVCRSRNLIPCTTEETRFDLQRAVVNTKPKRGLIFVYSYKNCCWKLAQDFVDEEYVQPFSLSLGTRGFSINGILHWNVIKARSRRRLIIGLDLNSYGLAEFELPPPCYNNNYFWGVRANLIAVDGRLGCFLDLLLSEVWVMEEYGVSKSWTKLLSISHSRIDSGLYWFDSTDIRVYPRRDSGEIVVFIHSKTKYKLFRYDVRKHRVQVYGKTRWHKSNNKIQVQLQRLKTRLKEACCLQTHT